MWTRVKMNVIPVRPKTIAGVMEMSTAACTEFLCSYLHRISAMWTAWPHWDASVWGSGSYSTDNENDSVGVKWPQWNELNNVGKEQTHWCYRGHTGLNSNSVSAFWEDHLDGWLISLSEINHQPLWCIDLQKFARHYQSSELKVVKAAGKST